MVFLPYALGVVSSPTIRCSLPSSLHLPPVPDALLPDCGVNSALWDWIKVTIRSNSMEKLIVHESKVTSTSYCGLVLCSPSVSLLVPSSCWSSYAGNISSRLGYLEKVDFFLRRLCCTVGYEGIFPVSSTVRHVVEHLPDLVEVEGSTSTTCFHRSKLATYRRVQYFSATVGADAFWWSFNDSAAHCHGRLGIHGADDGGLHHRHIHDHD